MSRPVLRLSRGENRSKAFFLEKNNCLHLAFVDERSYSYKLLRITRHDLTVCYYFVVEDNKLLMQ